MDERSGYATSSGCGGKRGGSYRSHNYSPVDSKQDVAQDHRQSPSKSRSDRIRKTLDEPQNEKKSWKHRFRAEVWLKALQILSILLWNTLVCVAFAWAANFTYSHGNITSGKPVGEQSDFAFIAGVILVAHCFFFCTVVAVQLPILLSLKFVGMPEDASSYSVALFCLGRLLRHTYRVYLLSVLVTLAAVFCLRPAIGKFGVGRVEFYCCCVISQLNNTALSIAERRIFVEDSVLGQSRQRSARIDQPHCGSVVRFMRIFLSTSPKAVTVVLAGVYVQVVSAFRIEGMRGFVAFTLGSLVLKFAVKKIAKLGIMRLDVNDPRSIFVVVGLPTVLIDTQVRIVLQRVPGAKYTLIWTAGMAVLEIVTRITKVYLTKREIRLKELDAAEEASATPVTIGGAAIIPAPVTKVHKIRSRKSPATDSRSVSQYNFEKWRHQVLVFQIAESYASMSAEYIAIGCSTSILYFYWDHPKYMLGGSSVHVNDSLLPWSRTSALGIQVLVEILVDYLSCVLEIGEGVDFQRIRQHRAFLGMLFASLATVNIQICALMYLSV
ncbi:hypothetical protein Gpo141_00008642 [Globisporangium polare]